MIELLSRALSARVRATRPSATLAVLGLVAAACSYVEPPPFPGLPAQATAPPAALPPEAARVGVPAGLFEHPHPWNRDVRSLPPSEASKRIIDWLAAHGGWGSGMMKVDFSIQVLHTDDAEPLRTFTPTDDFYATDCDPVPFPVPSVGAIEGENGYACDGDGDCHLLVVSRRSKKLYEMWRAHIDAGGLFRGGCAVVWDLGRAYPESLRGEGCSSADAAGLPIAPLVVSADEVASGSVPHALRFVLPNDRIRRNVYVHPATHSTTATRGGPDAPPYGVRLRLRADFPLVTLPSEGARVIARALQTYGMFLADGGRLPITAQSDRFTQHRWKELDVNAWSLASIAVTDMEVVDMGRAIDWKGECRRN